MSLSFVKFLGESKRAHLSAATRSTCNFFCLIDVLSYLHVNATTPVNVGDNVTEGQVVAYSGTYNLIRRSIGSDC